MEGGKEDEATKKDAEDKATKEDQRWNDASI
jgi:hypothetical protein